MKIAKVNKIWAKLVKSILEVPAGQSGNKLIHCGAGVVLFMVRSKDLSIFQDQFLTYYLYCKFDNFLIYRQSPVKNQPVKQQTR